MFHSGCAPVEHNHCNNTDMSYTGVDGCLETECYGSLKNHVCKTDKYTRSGETHEICQNDATWSVSSCPDCSSKGETRLRLFI